jgi:hypothetical protein
MHPPSYVASFSLLELAEISKLQDLSSSQLRHTSQMLFDGMHLALASTKVYEEM